ncbi:hypothetical protein FOS14_14515 [Skermania sp. ID1734]|uniref:hypothetical protein n=1 Tax=Skermania sp. ID1734 TaxID=2597516 RepID=UPI00117FC53F|nr:hypothetical protein [Skermania sp. ID1734]TSD98194.1 hypothetical protein FOS14_14515 [Skermania sp. ID1734]
MRELSKCLEMAARRRHRDRIVQRLGTTALGVVALVSVATLTASADPFPTTAPPVPTPVNLNDYCANPGAIGRLSNGRTVYCTRVRGTDAYVWSYTRNLLPRDPHARPYACDRDVCRLPDGSVAPNYMRCGILCGEPPTSGDVQSGLSACFNSGVAFEECERRTH